MADNISKLISFIDSINVAEEIEDDLLKTLAAQVVEDFRRDQDSMIEWSNMVEEGQRIAKQETTSKSEPWEGASNFKSPAILEASISFGDRSSTELLRGRNLVKADVIGVDKQGLKQAAADNVVEFMNWQINHQMRGWRKAQGKLMYELPSTGAVFKKTFFDPIDGVNKSELIHYPDFAINQSASTIDDVPFTHPMDFSVDEVFSRQEAGLWLDVKLYPDDADGDEGSNEDEEVTNSVDNPQRFLEQNCWFDLDEDGYREPYTVTVHEQTQQVVRIVARYDVSGFVVKDQTGNIRRLQPEDEQALARLNLIKIDHDQNIVPYEFIPSPDGTFLGIGYYHLLSSLSKGINGITNQLLDSGTLANLQGGFLARGFRKRMGNMRMKPGQWESTDISAQDLQAGIMPHQFKEPSTVLFTLNESLNNKLQNLTVNTDIKGVLAPNAPATTTLALIQESMLPLSAIMQRIIGAESEEFRQLFILDSRFTDPELYKIVLDNPEADFANDFNLAAFDIAPTASSDMSSKMQRLQRAEILILEAPNIALEGGDTRPLREAWFEAMGAEDMIGQVFPDPEKVTGEQAARLEAQQQQQRQQAMLLAIQVDHAERQIGALELDTASRTAERKSKIRLNLINMQKVESETILNLEKAESEQVKNQIDVYTTQLQGIREAITSVEREIDFDNQERERNVQRLRESPVRPKAVPPGIPS